MIRDTPLGALMIGIAGVVVACAAPSAATGFDRSACKASVVLLDEPARVFAAPRADSALVAVLEPKAAVYLCGPQTRWVAVLYPRPGERSDCTRRPAAAPCPAGWLATLPRHTVPD